VAKESLKYSIIHPMPVNFLFIIRILYKINVTSHVFHLLFSFRNQVSHFLPLLVLHVLVVTVYGLDFNNSAFGLSAGSESYLVCARSRYC